MKKNRLTMTSLAAAGALLCLGMLSAAANPLPSGKDSQVGAEQQQRITGSVVDNSGAPVLGASVIEKGTSNGAITDANGFFSINVRSGAILQISCIGFTTVETAASNGMTVVLQEDAEFLEETVVVGFGTQKKINLTGAVSAVDTDKAFGSKPITDVAKGLQGIVPGLTITYNTNDLDASPTMKIRGMGSVNGDNTPLILVDGVEVPSLSFVNPDNIKSISVLKDAASSSIYGSRAAWGVILITCKDGSGAKDKISVSYSNNFSWNEPIGLPKYITDEAGILAQLEEGILAQKNVDGSRIEAFGMYYDTLGDGIKRWFANYTGNLSNPTYTYGQDWEIVGGTPYYYRVSDPNKETFKTSFSQTHNVNVSGNSGKTKFNMGLGYTKNDGTLKAAQKNDVQRYNLNLSTNTQVNKWLNVGAKVMYTEKHYEYPYGFEASNSTMGILYYTQRFPTFFPYGYSDGAETSSGSYVAPDGKTYYDERTYGAKGLLFRHGNIYVANEAICNSDDQYITVGGNVKIDIAPGLSFYADYTRGRHNYENRSIRQPYYTANWSFPSRAAITTSNFINRTFVSRVTNTYNAYFDYLMSPGDANIALKIGANAEDITYDNQSLTTNGVQNPEIPTLNLTDGKAEASVNESLRKRATAGFFGRVNFDYKNRYLVELNGRYDGSSVFRTGKKWAFFSSGSLGYRISEEEFWEPLKGVVPALKIRASYGSVGNQALSSWYPYIASLSTTTVNWQGTDGNKKTSVSTPAAVNDNMTWERIRTLNVGFDAGFLNNDLTATFDWYMRENVGMLVAGNEIVRYVGIATAPLENGGNMRTLGWEFQLDYNHAFNKDLAVYGTFTLSDSKSKISKWNNTVGLLTGWYEGKEVGEIWGFQTDRYFESDADVASSPDQSKIARGSFKYTAGDIKYVDLDGSNVIDTGEGTIDNHGDLVRIGNALPRFEYALRLGAVYKGFDAEVLFQGVGKRDMWSTSTLFIPHTAGAQMNIFENQLDYWTESNKDAFFPRPYINSEYGSLQGLPGNSGCNNFAPQTKYLANLAYLRVKNVTVGYTLPQNLTQKIYIEKARLYFSVQNLLTFDHIGGVMDPELTGGWATADSVSGVDMRYAGRAMPFNRQWTFGAQISF